MDTFAFLYSFYRLQILSDSNRFDDPPMFHSHLEFQTCMTGYALYGLVCIGLPWVRDKCIRYWNESWNDFTLEPPDHFNWVDDSSPTLSTHFCTTPWTDISHIDSECPICYEVNSKQEWIQWPGCQHPYHRDCIEEWIKYNPTCPLCRHSLSSD